jgi:phosphotransferase family enzyme
VTALADTISTSQIDAALRCCGVLRDGSVRSVAVESSRNTILSRIARLRLEYDGNAGNAPQTLILKTGRPDRRGGGWMAGRQEVAFYCDVAAAMEQRLVPCCFAAHWDEATEDWHLLLEDLGESHYTATTWPLPPTLAQCEHIIETLARFHACWWNDARLGTSIGVLRDDAAVARLLQDLTKRFPSLADALPCERRLVYERLFAAGAPLLRRSYAQSNLTILHGDAHVWNCFLPRDGGTDIRLFDWDGWRIGGAATDLAYMMAMHWYPDRRHRIERQLLDRYHATLLAEGVRRYDRQALDDDYRWAVLWQITLPIFQASNGIPPVIWWNNLERIWLAFDELDCRELLP